ncbi:hypothetical protein ACFLUR_02095 [Chloroflexota bacterium]
MRVVDGKAENLFLTEMGVWVDNIPDSWIDFNNVSSIGSLDEPNTFDIGEFGLGKRPFNEDS